MIAFIKRGSSISIILFSCALAIGTQAQTLVLLEAIPPTGTFYSSQGWPPRPYDWVPDSPIYALGSNSFIIDDSSADYSTGDLTDAEVRGGSGVRPMDDEGGGLLPLTGDGSVTNSSDGGSSSYGYSFATNGLWLQVVNVTNSIVTLNLNNATDMVYEIWSKPDFSVTNWNIETEVFPTNQNVMPFAVDEQSRSNLVVWARDWTGITSDGNTTPEWWFYEYYGTVNLMDDDLDSQGRTLVYDYQNNINPGSNVIYFSVNTTKSLLQHERKCPDYRCRRDTFLHGNCTGRRRLF